MGASAIVRSPSVAAALPHDPILAAQPARSAHRASGLVGAGRAPALHLRGRPKATSSSRSAMGLRQHRGRYSRPVQALQVLSVAYDPWAATQLAQRLSAERVPVIEFRANTQNFSEPTKELDAAMRATGSCMTAIRCWNGASVMWSAATTQGPMSILGRPGRNRRSTRPSRSSWQSPAAWPRKPARSVYESRGVIFIG